MHQGSSFSDNPSKSRGNRGRLKVRWGVYVDVDVPRVLEELIKGPWDPEGRLWARQVDMACEVSPLFVLSSESVACCWPLLPSCRPFLPPEIGESFHAL